MAGKHARVWELRTGFGVRVEASSGFGDLALGAADVCDELPEGDIRGQAIHPIDDSEDGCGKDDQIASVSGVVGISCDGGKCAAIECELCFWLMLVPACDLTGEAGFA